MPVLRLNATTALVVISLVCAVGDQASARRSPSYRVLGDSNATGPSAPVTASGAHHCLGQTHLPVHGCSTGAYRVGNGIQSPKTLKQVLPVYTQAGVRNRIEGALVVDAVVGQDGAVTCVDVTKPLDAVHGLDYAAVKAIQEWTFAPGTRLGIAVPVIVSIRVAFTLKGEQVVATLMSPTPRK